MGGEGTDLNRKKWGSEFKPVDISAFTQGMNDVVGHAANNFGANVVTGGYIRPPTPPPQIVVGGGTAPSAGGGWGGQQGEGDVKSQLKAGFVQAGRQDLADMVDTPEFSTWVNQESGWNPNSVSPANNQGKPNYGLFQFWAGHDFARPNMSPTEQAYLAATKFNLTPDRIRGFANQIRSGRYQGWGGINLGYLVLVTLLAAVTLLLLLVL